MQLRFPQLAVLPILCLLSVFAEETERKFQTPEGRYWTGTLVDVKGDRVIIKSADGKQGAISLAKLSEPDKRYIARFLTQQKEATSLGPEQIAKETELAASLPNTPREWTSADGKKLEGKLESYDGTEVQLRTPKGVFKFAASRLSDLDQRLLRRWVEQTPARIGKWPEFAEAPANLELETLKEGVEGWPYISRSAHFEFRSASRRLSKDVILDVAKTFEGTLELVGVLPVGFEPKPPESGYFLTEIYETADAYLAAGGLKGSAGCFTPKGNKIMVPLVSLGIDENGRWLRDRDKDNRTLNHEITHQVTQKWLARWPVWFLEGIAEYVEGLPCNRGRYMLKDISGDVRKAIMKYPVKGSYFPMVPLEKLMTMDHESWSKALEESAPSSTTGPNQEDPSSHEATYKYRSAHALVFYFLHLDGKGDGTTVATYLRALNQGEEPKKAVSDVLMRGRDYSTLSKEVADKLRSAGIRIEYQ